MRTFHVFDMSVTLTLYTLSEAEVAAIFEHFSKQVIGAKTNISLHWPSLVRVLVIFSSGHASPCVHVICPYAPVLCSTTLTR